MAHVRNNIKISWKRHMSVNSSWKHILNLLPAPPPSKKDKKKERMTKGKKEYLPKIVCWSSETWWQKIVGFKNHNEWSRIWSPFYTQECSETRLWRLGAVSNRSTQVEICDMHFQATFYQYCGSTSCFAGLVVRHKCCGPRTLHAPFLFL